MTHLVIVLGMHRSGTSAITRSLAALGVDLGDTLLGGLENDNEKGFWEDQDVLALNIEALEMLGGQWHSLTPPTDAQLNGLAASDLAVRAADLLRDKLRNRRLFGLKDPRMVRLLPFWQTVCDRQAIAVSYVIACRNPISVARSLARRNGFDLTTGYVLWLDYVSQCLERTAQRRRMVVDYDRLMDNPPHEMRRIADHLHLPFDPDSPLMADYCRNFLEDRLRHTRFTQTDIDLENMAPPPLAALFAALSTLAQDGDSSQADGAISAARTWLDHSRVLLTRLDRSAAQTKNAAQLETALSDSKAELSELTAQRHERDLRLERMRQQLTEYGAALADRERQITQLSADLTKQRQLNADRQTALDRQAALAADNDQTIGELVRQISIRDGALAARDTALAIAQTELNESTQREQASERIQSVQSKQIAALQDEIGGHLEGLDQLNRQLTASRAAVTQWESTYRQLQGQTDALRQQAAEATAKTVELAALSAETGRLRQEIADRERVIAQLQLSPSWRVTKPLRLAARWLRPKPSAAALAWQFHTANRPDVSIIIPVYHHLQQTLDCLDSIARHSGHQYSYEIIVADDGVDAPVAPHLPKTAGLRAHLNRENLGFLRNCNAAAQLARGRYLLFLNNDTLVEENWLAPLVRLADSDPQAGLVGCKLLNADGTIQDAGWTISQDGWGHPIGRNHPADSGEHDYVRQVDCVGGACFLVAKALFDLAGGFDDALAPAYYEEFDLAFALRQRGYKTLYQPESRVRHLGSCSYGAETRDRLSVINHGKFVAKWHDHLHDQPQGNEAPFILSQRHGGRPAILLIDDRIPEYDHHAGGLAIDQYLGQMQRMGWRVIFAPADGQARAPYAGRLRQLGIEIVHQPDSLDHWLERHGPHLAVIWTARPQISLPLLPLFRRTSPAKLVYFTHDLHYLREQRRYEIERKPDILVTAATVREQELAVFTAVDRVLSPSEDEARIIRADAPGCDVQSIPLYLYPTPHPPVPGFAGRQDMVFVGGFPHLPNVDAALWLVNQIMPLVWRQVPLARLLLIGYAPPPEVLALAGPLVQVTGVVPDLAPYYARARLAVAPLRYGAGVKGKIVAAMDAGVPVVTTPIGAEGIGLTDGVTALIADGAAALADRLVRLLQDDRLCRDLAEAGIQLVEDRFSEQAAEQALRRALDFTAADDDLAGRFCSQPWTYVETYNGGGTYVCCPAWNNNRPIGNILTDTVDQLWNSDQAQAFRSDILDGTFSQCDRVKCNMIVGRRLPRRDQIDDAELRHIIANRVVRMERGPRVVKLGYDASCNLACPSCRTEVAVADKAEQAKLDRLFAAHVLPLLHTAQILLISSDGDPFAAHHYRQVMKQTADLYPALKIGLTTNGQLLDRKAWEECRLEGRVCLVQVSVDAASAETYAIVRRPGNFHRLMANLEFLADLRRTGRIDKFELPFVVQARNYREMGRFILLAKSLAVDTVIFTLIDHWGRGMDDQAYADAKIWDRDHPDFADFAQSLTDPIFDDPIVRLNGLQAIRDGWQPPELTVTHGGEIHRKAAFIRPPGVKPDVILVQAPGWGVNTPPLALATLTAYARSQGFTVLPMDLNLEFYTARSGDQMDAWELEQSLWFWQTESCVTALLERQAQVVDNFIATVVASHAPVIGFTVYDSSLLATLELARRIKQQRPEVLIVLGGPQVSVHIGGPEAILNDAVDAIAQGEGEATLLDILHRVKDGRSLDDCPGLLLRRDGQMVQTPPRETIKKLDTLPAADFSDYDFALYRTPTRLPMMSSRGCPNACIYCNERHYWRSFRHRSAEAIFAEIQAQIERHPFLDFIDFQDSLVNGKISELERLADLIIASNLRIGWAGQAVIRKEMTRDLLVKLKRSGCVCLAYGLETPSPSLMRAIGKHLSKDADIHALAQAHGESGLNAVYNVMFGLPGETEADAFAVLEFLRRNRKYGLTVNPSPSFCLFSPGTPGYEQPEKFGIDLTKGHLYWEAIDGSSTYPIRLKRFEDFCRMVADLGIATTYPHRQLLDRNRTLGRHHHLCGQLDQARDYYRAWLNQHPHDHEIRNAMSAISPHGPPKITYALPTSTDGNWINGIATSWETAFFVPHSAEAAEDFQPGYRVVFADGDQRRITGTRQNAQSLIVTLDGPPLDGRRMGEPAVITVIQEQPEWAN